MKVPYSSYQNSGVEWIGKIPVGWEVKRIKYFTTLKKETSNDGSEELLSVSEYSGVMPRRILLENAEHLTSAESLKGYIKVSKGNLVNNIMLMWKKGLGVSDYEGIVSPAYSVFEFKNSIPRYFNYLFRTDLYITEYRKNSRGIIDSRLRLYDDEFRNIFSIIPSLSEQQQIVSFLDHKTSLIDSLIEKTQQNIELIKEQRTSLINQYITKGLDPNVDMKDSGVKWIGEIPSHWEVKRIKYLGKIKSGDSITANELNEDSLIPVYGGNGIIGFFSESNYSETIIVIGRVGEKCGNIYLVKDTCWVSDNALVLRLNNHKLYDWVSFALESRDLNKIRNQNAQPLITSTQLSNESVPLPSLVDMKSITSEISKKVKWIDELIFKETKRIELCKEYRKSLISNVVTGKIDIRNEIIQ